jgi:hypothetical protein
LWYFIHPSINQMNLGDMGAARVNQPALISTPYWMMDGVWIPNTLFVLGCIPVP